MISRLSAVKRLLCLNSSLSFSTVVRLPRPSRVQAKKSSVLTSTRPNAITLFPGDFTDDNDIWEDEEENEEYQQEETNQFTEELRQQEEQAKADKERWLRNAQPPERVSMVDDRGRAYGRGARKRASARVWIQPGTGEVVVNRRDWVSYFPRLTQREDILKPLIVTETIGRFDVQVITQGGGTSGQAGAARLGIANALNAYDPDRYRPALKKLGLLTRDARKVQRKVVGRVKARKSPQWVKR